MSTVSRFVSRFAVHTAKRLSVLQFCRQIQTHAVKLNPRKTDLADYFTYSTVVVGSQANITENFAKNAIRFCEPQEPVDLKKARLQHENHVKELTKLVQNVVVVPTVPEFPDQIFVEDPAVVLDGTAFITQMKPATRAGEPRVMKSLMENLGMKIVEMKSPEAYLEGGDVLFTGREFLVGLSNRTNAAGIECLKKAFPEWPVTGIRVLPPVLHLKSMSSMAGVDLIAISETKSGNHAWKEIESNAHFKYKKLGFPDDNGANCLFINGTVLHPPKNEYPDSFKVWKTLECPRVELPNSELTKTDGSLTCNSIRIN